ETWKEKRLPSTDVANGSTAASSSRRASRKPDSWAASAGSMLMQELCHRTDPDAKPGSMGRTDILGLVVDHASTAATLSVVAGCIVGWGFVSARLESWRVSAPIAFVLLGLGLTHGPTALVHLQLHSSTIRSVAEITLALVLFSDASRVNARTLAG